MWFMNARDLPAPVMFGSVAIGYGQVQVIPGVKDDGTGPEKEEPGMTAIGNLTETAGGGEGDTGKPMCECANSI